MIKRFHQWRNVAAMVEKYKMPPKGAEQPSDDHRRQLVTLVRGELRRVAIQHADDPGPLTLRRLTSAEYAYTTADLTGLDLAVERDFVSDAVGGEGFTNVGDAQFMQDSTVERYLSAAKRVADHAVIGSGPLRFHHDPGKIGLELSAITQIQNIYRRHGFRTAAGEGGEPFGLDRYSQAFFVAWRFQYRQQLGLKDETLASLAAQEKMDAPFAEYIWSILSAKTHSFPTSEIIEQWRTLPSPSRDESNERNVRRQCDRLQKSLRNWHDRLGENPDAKEEARILEENSFDVSDTKQFEMNVNWPQGTKAAHVTFAVESADGDDRADSVVIWRAPTLQFRIPDQILRDPLPLENFVTEKGQGQIKFGAHPRGGKVKLHDFVTVGTKPQTIELPIVDGATSARLFVEAKLDAKHGDDRIIRCTISQQEETDQGKSVSALLADPTSSSFQKWKNGVLEFARLLPQISHREPAPSDRDPIPSPFDASYNNAQRNYFHAYVKYHRDDRFLVENMLDDDARRELDRAWVDLLGSFEYHDAFLRVVAETYPRGLSGRGIADLDSQTIENLPDRPRKYVQQLHREYHAIRRAFRSAQPEHVENVLRFADLAWRRPLTPDEQDRLQSFYRALRQDANLEHPPAIRLLLARVLTAPAYLYRAEKRTADHSPTPLSNWELASRLSYFLWSSSPDETLRRAASEGELSDPDELVRQARRMLQDPKARRLAAEFFGQWLGFYRFDQYRGVDGERFPKFTNELKAAMHEEAVSFFDHIVRHDRPVREILFADYSFMNRELARHYGIEWRQKADKTIMLEPIDCHHRGGLFGLGAVLTVTSAPRRTSPVKRGDWILRRIMGTPVPPPPADAGSIPADDVLADGKTVGQRLAAHRRETSCQNCHSRIDPLGFALENFDAIGRWRDRYRDGQPIDSSGTLRDGTEIAGLGDLRAYLAKNQTLFHRTLCTKLVGYAFGRGESIADVMLIENMIADLEREGRFSRLVENIVRSKQFRYRR